MKLRFMCLSVIVLVGSAAATARMVAGPDDTSPSADERLATLRRFEGEWTIDGRWTSGDELHARSIYALSLGKAIMRTQTFVKNGASEYQRYEGIFAWHPKKKSLFHISFAYNGEISETLVESKDKDTLLLGWSPFQEGVPSNVRQTITFTDADTFLWKVELKGDDGWKTLMNGTWHRKKN